MKDVAIHESWKPLLQPYFETNAFTQLAEFVRSEYQRTRVYPHPKNMFAAFDATPFDNIKVVILGQDPYHGPQQANGLCFSVQEEIPYPPSLQNIFKELQSDLGIEKTSGDLSSWAQQGVFLLNATLTVLAGQAGSHQGKGWEEFTDYVIKTISEQKEGIVFILWGSYAQKKGQVINTSKHFILKSPHPSPLSAHRGFFGSKPFSQVNNYLTLQGKEPIQW